MGATKRAHYADELLELADLFKALGHPARLSILQNIAKDQELNCKELNEKIPLAQSTISQHLKLLYVYGAVGYKVIGNNAYYSVNHRVIKKCIEGLDRIELILKKHENNEQLSFFLPYLKAISFLKQELT